MYSKQNNITRICIIEIVHTENIQQVWVIRSTMLRVNRQTRNFEHQKLDFHLNGLYVLSSSLFTYCAISIPMIEKMTEMVA